MTVTLKIANQSFCMHSSSWWCITIPSLVIKCKAVYKISYRRTLTIWPLTVTLTMNAVIQSFSQDTLAYDDVSSDQVWLPKNQQFRRYSSRKSHILITWALAVTLTLKIANNFFPAWHSGSWCCTTIPSLVTKRSAVQKISGQTFTNILNLSCHLDLECSKLILPQNTPVYDGVLSQPVWLQKDQQFRRKSRNSRILIM